MLTMRAVVCGIDPGLGATGYAVLRSSPSQVAVLDAGVCRGDPEAPLAERLVRLVQDVDAVFREHKPDCIAVEQLYAHYAHPRTAILMGHARGVILMSAAKQGIEVHSYAATRVKRFLTGNGRASKSQMQSAIQRELGLATLPEPSDLADALAIALCCAEEVNRQALVGSV